ncbi:MAG TPA: MFS transporter [Chloroflexia bacterium]|nr:MFS transporter [Chloroflexia bacterium]
MKKLHYAWIILILCFLGLLATQGVRLSFGAFVNPWEKEFKVDRSTISLVSLVSFVIYGVTQPLAGRLTDKYGVRRMLSLNVLLVGISILVASMVQSTLQLVLLYGIIASLGFSGASGVVASVAVTKWFQSNRGLAFSLIEAGFGAGQFILVPSSLFLIDAWGWRSTFLLFGVLLVILFFPLLLLLRSHPEDKGLRPYSRGEESGPVEKHSETALPAEQNLSKKNIFANRAFWGLALPFFVCGITTTGMIDTHLIPFAHDHGYTTTVTSATVSLLAAFNILGTLASGPLSDRWDNRRILGTLYGVRALTIVLLLITNQSYWLIIFGVVFGLVDFAVVAPTQVLASRYFHGHSVGVVFGLLSMSHQLGSSIGAYIPGLLYTITGNYTVPFIAGAVLLEVAAFLSFTLPRKGMTAPPRKLVEAAEAV